MKLFLLRHCEATPGERMDADRTLTPRGVEQAKTMRKFRKSIGLKFDVVFSSDFRRALDTALIVGNHKAPYYQLKELRPLGTPEEAWAAIYATAKREGIEILDEARVLVVTHGPLIQHFAAAAWLGFSPEQSHFSHGSIMRIDTHELPADKHPLHWLVRPSLYEELQDGELTEATTGLRESLNQSAKARVVDPLISKLNKSLAKRFRAQARDYKASGWIHKHPTVFDRVTYDAYMAGGAMAYDQIGDSMVEAWSHDPGTGRTALPVVREAKKQPLLPVAIATAMAMYTRSERELERELDATSEKEIAAAVAGGAAREDIAKLIAEWATARAQTIAEYEVSQAYHSGAGAAARLIGQQQGVQVEKAWDVDTDPCEVCLGNVDDGWIPEDILFASGESEPPQHPNCRCSLSYRTVGGEE